MRAFSTGKRALGVCDRCGFVYKLNKLKREYVDQKQTELLVCRACRDVDHPQLQLGKYPVHDPQALRNPRPDRATFGGSRAVLNQPMGVSGRGDVGTVEVVV